MHRPSVSVVTAVLNRADEIVDTLDSVLSQTYEAIEHVIIDGGSTDGTLDAINARKGRVAFLSSEPDKGLYDAMNKGLAASSGEFVFFLNAGDTFDAPDVIERIAAAISDPDVCYFGAVRIRSRLGSWLIPSYVPTATGTSTLLPHHQSIFYPRAFFSTERYNLRYRILADGDFTSRAIKLHGKKFVPVIVANSHIGGFGTNVFQSWKKTMDYNAEMLAYHADTSGMPSKFKQLSITLGNVFKYSVARLLGSTALYQVYRLANFVRTSSTRLRTSAPRFVGGAS